MSPSPGDLYQQTVSQAESNLGVAGWLIAGILVLVTAAALWRYK